MNSRWTRTVQTPSASLDLGEVHELRSVQCQVAGSQMQPLLVQASPDSLEWWTVLDRTHETAIGTVAAAVTGTARFLRATGPAQVTSLAATIAPSGVDITHLCRAQASSHRPVREPWRMLEGDVTASWQAADGDDEPHVTIELPATRQVLAVEHVWSSRTAAPPMLSTSLDGVHWTPAPGALRPGVIDSVELHTQARYLRAQYAPDAPPVGAIRVFAAADPNDGWLEPDLAAGCAASASTSMPRFLPQHAVRTDEACWRPAGDDPEPAWQVDLGHACTVHDVEVSLAGTAAGGGAEVHLGTEPGQWRAWDGTPTAARWVRLRLPGTNVAVRQVLVRGQGSPQRSRWWETGGPTYRYFPKEYGVHLNKIAADLPALRERGFRCIELAGIKQGPPSAFAGLGATDPYAVDDRIGTNTDLVELIEQAHRYGIRVVVFDNLGYAHTRAADFRAAAERFRLDPEHADPYPYLLSEQPRGDRWHRDDPTGVYYYGYWGPDLPSYDWADPRWREESRRMLRFWLGHGMDGLGIDAPQVYPGIDEDAAREYIGAVLASAGRWAFAEGIHTREQGHHQDVYAHMIADQGFTVILDLTISVWHQPEDNALVPAIEAADLSGLEALLNAGRDVVASAGGVTIEAPAWEADLGPDGTVDPARRVPAERRLLEIAILAAAGSFFYLTDGVHTYRPEVETIAGWTPAQQYALDQVLRSLAGHTGLGPAGSRVLVPTDEPGHLAWLRTDRTGVVRAITVFNASDAPARVRLDLRGLGVLDQRPRDLLGGDQRPAISAGECTVELDAYGYTYLGIE